MAPSDAPAVRQRLHDRGMGCIAALSLPREAAPPEAPDRAVEVLSRAIDSCVMLGAPLLSGAIYTPLGYRGAGAPKRRDVELTADVLRTAARHAETRGIRLGIEPLNRYETSLINTTRQALDLIELVGESNLMVQLDTFHMNIEERGFGRAIRDAGERLVFVQLCESDRGIPGTGNVDWADVCDGLRSIGYEGRLGLESFNSANQALVSATCLWRDVVGDPNSFVDNALHYLRTCLEEELPAK
jgi:D-psicose/D-tagatose/L-ribulose 3-epimerase